MKQILKQILKNKGIKIEENQLEKFDQFYNLLMEENKRQNLTRIISKEDVATKHFFDSLVAIKFIPNNSNIIDIGAGGGFPSIPLKIMNSSLNITMVDSENKKVEFLNTIVKKLNLEKCKAIHGRVEDIAHDEYREKFDICVARAVAPLQTLLEYCIPFLKINGVLLAYKGSMANEEILKAKNAFSVLNCNLHQIYKYVIEENRENYLLIIKKNGRTNLKYPRRNNNPRKNPL